MRSIEYDFSFSINSTVHIFRYIIVIHMQYCCILTGCDFRSVYTDLYRSGWLYFGSVYQEFDIVGEDILDGKLFFDRFFFYCFFDFFYFIF